MLVNYIYMILMYPLFLIIIKSIQLLLPHLLLLFDPVIRKTTLGGKNLYDPRKKKKSAAQSATNTRASTEQKKM